MAENREYWLGHCEGFDIRAGDRHVGVVEYVRYGSAHDHPDALFALTGKRIQVSMALVCPTALTVSHESCIPNGSMKSTARRRFHDWPHRCWR